MSYPPIRVDIATGEILPPTGLDPYALPWVEGASQTVPGFVRREYPQPRLPRRRKDRPNPEEWADYGPRRRSREFKALHGQPLPADGQPVWKREYS
jgi:hypothetical protein